MLETVNVPSNSIPNLHQRYPMSNLFYDTRVVSSSIFPIVRKNSTVFPRYDGILVCMEATTSLTIADENGKPPAIMHYISEVRQPFLPASKLIRLDRTALDHYSKCIDGNHATITHYMRLIWRRNQPCLPFH